MLIVDDNFKKNDTDEILMKYWINNNIKDCSKSTIEYVTTRSKPNVSKKKEKTAKTIKTIKTDNNKSKSKKNK